MNGAQLLAQIELALVLLDLHFGLLLHILHDARARHLALEAREDEANALADIEALEDLVLVGDAEIEIGRGKIGEASRIGDVHLEDLRHFARDALDHAREGLGRGHRARDEFIEFRRIGRCLAGALHARDGVRLHLIDVLDGDAAQPLERDLDCVAGEVDALVHTRGDAHLAHEPVRIDRIFEIAAGDHQCHDQPRFLVLSEQGEVLRCAHLHGDGAEGKDDRRAERHERQRGRQLGTQDLVLLLPARHGQGRESRRCGHVEACEEGSGGDAYAIGVTTRGATATVAVTNSVGRSSQKLRNAGM
ncbi:MAG: hypothetical protein MUD17_06165 [Gemmatimonadaceae bacterium]|nr:hypothetical protein [Gemmatimonadaceae bacterium]